MWRWLPSPNVSAYQVTPVVWLAACFGPRHPVLNFRTMSCSEVLKTLPIPSLLTHFSQESLPFRHSVSPWRRRWVRALLFQAQSRAAILEVCNGAENEIWCVGQSLSIGVGNNNNGIIDRGSRDLPSAELPRQLLAAVLFPRIGQCNATVHRHSMEI
jgi:hypothetical protein